MVRVKMNFKKSYANFDCSLCSVNGVLHSDSQQNLLNCSALLKSSTILATNTTIKYEHLFSKNIDQVIDAIKLLKIALKTRESLLETNSDI